MENTLPSELSYWARMVQRKVTKYWEVPGGIRIDPKNNQAKISFWVDRKGNLIGEPVVIQHANHVALAQSGLRALKLAAPFPPLPDTYIEPEVQVVYTFTLVR
ncbi:MAG: TonB family protein [Candidatus Hydrogenedentota bacterium]